MDLDNVMYVVYEHTYEDYIPLAICATHADAEEFALAVAEERVYVNFIRHLRYYEVEDFFIEKDADRRLNRFKTVGGYLLSSTFYSIIEPVGTY